MKQVVVIGAGLGGLSAAIRLAASGCKVTVLERQPAAGGKLQRVEAGDYRFDRGPSTITMPHAFRQVFQSVGREMEDYLTLSLLEPGTRNVFADGAVVDFSGDHDAMEEQIGRYSSKDALAYRAFMKESKKLYELSEQRFLNRLLLNWKDKIDIRLVAGLLRVRPFVSLRRLLGRYFKHPNTLAMFGRYATYVGSSPFRAPAIFAMLPYLEQQGVYHVKGGTYGLVVAFERLAREMGADIRFGAHVTEISSAGGRVTGVASTAGDFPADVIVVNGDVLTVASEQLTAEQRPSLPDAKRSRMEPSLSGFVVMAGVRRRFEGLLHHTVFYPENYGAEFHDIFNLRQPAADPAIYVCHSGYSEPGMAPADGSNLFILANAPYLSSGDNWRGLEEDYRDHLLETLEKRGLAGLNDGLEASAIYTPEQLHGDTRAYRGAIYGISSNSAKQTFFRPSNQGDLKGLWFAGGTTNPGGGTPLVTLSGLMVAKRILELD
jgi:phytoene desaturase